MHNTPHHHDWLQPFATHPREDAFDPPSGSDFGKSSHGFCVVRVAGHAEVRNIVRIVVGAELGYIIDGLAQIFRADAFALSGTRMQGDDCRSIGRLIDRVPRRVDPRAPSGLRNNRNWS